MGRWRCHLRHLTDLDVGLLIDWMRVLVVLALYDESNPWTAEDFEDWSGYAFSRFIHLLRLGTKDVVLYRWVH